MNFITKSILLLTILLLTVSTNAQVNIFNREGNTDTTITSDKLLLDAKKNIAVFTGNVDVDDEEYKIRCDKMIIYKKSKDNKEEEKKSDSFEMEIIGKDSKVTKIECLGHVIIVRKLPEKEERKEGKQVGTSGKAVFDLVENKITLSEKPVLSQKTKMIEADLIVHDLNKAKTEFLGNVKITRKGEKKEE